MFLLELAISWEEKKCPLENADGLHEKKTVCRVMVEHLGQTSPLSK